MQRFTLRPRRESGIALIIILAFLVLLMGLVVAFFSRAVMDRQISNSSAQQTKVELFADGAVETITGDLKQEIAAGSMSPSSSNPSPNTHLYFPKAGVTAVPYRVGTTDSLPNLVKRSAYQQAFYAGSSYDIANYPASNRAANVSSTSLSQNSRSFSVTRWNKPLLLPKQNLTSDTDLSPVTSYTAPDWVLVARDGSNPVNWSSTMSNAAGPSFVVGRYAYNIYDEGGLLDMNVAGYPTGVTAVQAGNKSALAFADLRQLKDSSGKPLITQAQIDAFIAWRNYASTQAPSDFPTPAFTATSGQNYVNAITSNAKGFLAVGNTALYNNQSDRMLAGRQQLMKLLLSSIASQDSGSAGQTERANLQDALQYLGTFSRDISQPSFVRPQSLDSSAPGYAAGAPKILDITKGGSEGATGDLSLNPAFLMVRVSATGWKRNDGTDVVLGEPLVKKRFALSRLAWLTYKGPIADDSGNLGADTDIQTIITALTKTSGLSSDFLKLGGPANIKKYFGLDWDSTNNRWKYTHGQNGTNGPIMTLSKVAALGSREPDFFELLKAAMCAGSLGKTYMYSSAAPTDSYWLTPTGYQEERDSSIDAHVMQIGANIIDQFDLDSYPTRIAFDDGSLFGNYSSHQEYRGVEDLPYLYRVREGKIMVQDSVPPQYNLPMVGTPTPFSAGTGVVVQEPEIWNPHAWNPKVSDNYPRPTDFQLQAVSNDPNGATPSSQTTAQPVAQWRCANGSTLTSPASLSSSPAAVNTTLQFQIPQSRRDLFREPTLLLKSNVPTGSNLMGGTRISALYPAAQYVENGVTDDKNYLCIVLGTVPMAWQTTIPAGGIDGTAPSAASAGIAPAGFASYTTYINGITYRLQYKDPSGNWATYDEKYTNVANAGSYNNWSGEAPPSYNQKTFNRKANNPYANDNIGCELSLVCFDPRTSRFGMSFSGGNGRGANCLAFPLGATTDNRFGDKTNAGSNPLFDLGWAAPMGSATASASVQAAAGQNAALTSRPDEYRGFAFTTYEGFANAFGFNVGPANYTGAPSNWSNQSVGGWYPANALAITSPSYGTPAVVEPGMFSQNDPATNASTNGARFANDPQGLPTSGTYTNSVSWANPRTASYDYTRQYFADADGVIRRAMAAYVPAGNGNAAPAVAPTSGQPSGLPMKPATSYSGGVGSPNTTTNEYASRPIVLNRPYRSVAELGYVFSGTPWRNLDMNTPESAAAAMLDVFCVNDTDDPNCLVAGKVNLNTRQSPVLQAILSGTGKDEFDIASSALAAPVNDSVAKSIADALVARTTSSTTGMGPLANLSELVGKWNSAVNVDSYFNGGKSYVGFSSDATNNSNDLTTLLSANFPTEQRVARFREAAIRSLAGVGQTRVWNVMIDLVAQTGRYPKNAAALDQFLVEGEQRYWVHLAIDRYTGEILDKQVELVKE